MQASSISSSRPDGFPSAPTASATSSCDRISQRSRRRHHGRKIQEHFYRGGESDLKVAILEADKLLNDALREAGIVGIQLGDRLKKRATQIPNLNDLWHAHKLRNQIAHEPNFRLKRDLAERALGIYETAFKNLGIFQS